MNMIELLKVILLGIVQGISEWLPISSTGHMILVNQLMPMQVQDEFMKMFLVVIQFGSILAVLLLYFNKLNPFASNKRRREKEATLELWFKVIVAVFPAAVIGLLFDDWIHQKFYGYFTIAIMLILYGILFIVMETRNKRKRPRITELSEITYPVALMIGMFQVLALIPGTSRSGATILGAVLIGTSRFVAAEFSFFLAIPVMFGASLLKVVKFVAGGGGFTGDETVYLLLGMVVAFAVSVFAIKFLMGYIKKHDFKAFGYYRIILGIIVLLYFSFFVPKI